MLLSIFVCCSVCSQILRLRLSSMFFYVKFDDGICEVAEKKQIRHLQLPFNKYKKYNVLKERDDKTYQALILFQGDSLEDLQAKIDTRRTIVPPSHLINSASELSELEFSSSVIQASKKDDNKEKILKNKLLSLKSKNALKRHQSTMESDNLLTKCLIDIKKEKTEEDKQNKENLLKIHNTDLNNSNISISKEALDKKSKTDVILNKKAKTSTKNHEKTKKEVIKSNSVQKKKKVELKNREFNSKKSTDKSSKTEEKLKETNKKTNQNNKSKETKNELKETENKVKESTEETKIENKRKADDFTTHITKKSKTVDDPVKNKPRIISDVPFIFPSTSTDSFPSEPRIGTNVNTQRIEQTENDSIHDKTIAVLSSPFIHNDDEEQKKTAKNVQSKKIKIKSKSKKEKKTEHQNESNDLRKELKKKEIEVKNLKSKVEHYKLLLKNEKIETEKLRNLNANMQMKVFEKLDEYASNGANPFERFAGSDAAVGFQRKSDGTIHCGNNIYISKTDYDNAKNSAAKAKKTNSQFVKDIAVTIIGYETLMNSSVTGRKCNRTQTQPKTPLDPTQLGAVYDIFEYYLKTEKKMDPVQIAAEQKSVGAYIAAKIWDLNRPKRVRKEKKEVMEELTDSDEDELSEKKDEDNKEGEKDDGNKEDEKSDDSSDDNAESGMENESERSDDSDGSENLKKDDVNEKSEDDEEEIE